MTKISKCGWIYMWRKKEVVFIVISEDVGLVCVVVWFFLTLFVVR